MDSETWMNANKAIKLGFADDILEEAKPADIAAVPAFAFSTRLAQISLMNKLEKKFMKEAKAENGNANENTVTQHRQENMPAEDEQEKGRLYTDLVQRLNLIKPN